jgi:hypothetical protein
MFGQRGYRNGWSIVHASPARDARARHSPVHGNSWWLGRSCGKRPRTYRHDTCGHGTHGRELAAVLALHAGGDAGDLRRRPFLADAARRANRGRPRHPDRTAQSISRKHRQLRETGDAHPSTGRRLCPGRIRRRNSVPTAGQGSRACVLQDLLRRLLSLRAAAATEFLLQLRRRFLRKLYPSPRPPTRSIRNSCI